MKLTRNGTVQPFVTRNVFADLFLPYKRRPGFTATNQIPVISAFYNGVNKTEEEEVRNFNQAIAKCVQQHAVCLVIQDQMPSAAQPALINHVKAVFSSLTEPENDLVQLADRLLPEAPDHVKSSFVSVLSIYRDEDTNFNKSRLLNLVIKIIFWYETYIKSSKFDSERLDEHPLNPKLIYYGQISTHATYFFIFLRFLGFDQLFASFKKQDKGQFSGFFSQELQWIDNQNSLELKVNPPFSGANSRHQPGSPSSTTAPKTTGASDKPFTRPSVPLKSAPKRPVPKAPISSKVIITHKRMSGTLDNLKEPLRNRAGYVGEPSPIIPSYFVRYIGTDVNESMYNNRLYHLDKFFSDKVGLYKLITSSIPIGNYQEITAITKDIWPVYETMDLTKLESFVEMLKGCGVFGFIKHDFVKEHAYQALRDTLIVAIDGNESMPTAKFKNVCIKLIGWMSDFVPQLFSALGYENQYNPKVIFYGDIKPHEALFLIVLNKLGVDILYVNTFEDDIFSYIDPNETFTELVVLDKVVKDRPFPKALMIVQQQTTAYQASEEIARVIYDDQGGIYKPWQFEHYNTVPNTLKTTYEEMLILWHQASRIRTGFNVVGENVYIPNLFVKISGVDENMSDYSNTVNTLTKGAHTIFYKRLPFTGVDFSRQALSEVAVAFTDKNELTFEKLTKLRSYRFSHLNSHLQHKLYDKMKLLLTSDLLLNRREDMFSFKVVASILNLDSALIEKIQTFDYPADIPKVVIYDRDETVFSESDAITTVFLYLMGFDICILTPTGYDNFEMHINKEYVSLFKLHTKAFNLDLSQIAKNNKSKNFFSNLFK
ncbi:MULTISPECIES: YceG family protein [unclassified Fusibacter]|uniref:YceG family protein n=1 Tax=unclassified Fusibacter TaxID=2624464 RepID=UPI00101081D5|nr:MULTISPECIES: YceG family protein [unclassified Fusibacter]MCK8058237.1 YceG family protein [Fusibacter sp. A2]NPE20820.1 hypothetical protein [Fusibacter sp. A1]RXV63024.1 hypothetical protein DWB64_03225 [Fusibacter sp. A1]